MRCPNLLDLPEVSSKVGWPWTEGSPTLPETTPDGREWPRISIVTPSYNQGQFIEETVRSVLLQGYPNLEYIIMDGDSTDRSIEIIKKYEKWLTFWVSEQDGGQSNAVNRGWERSTGNIIAWINSDDVYLPESLHAVALAYHDNPNNIVFCGKAIIADEELKTKSIKKSYHFELERFLQAGNVPGQPSVFITKIVFNEIGGLDETLHQSMDRDYWIRISLHYPHGPYCYLEQALSITRDWSGTKTATGYFNIKKERFIVLEKAFSNPKLPEELVHKHPLCLEMFKHRLAVLAQGYAQEYKIAGKFSSACKYAVESYKLYPLKYNLWHTSRFCLRAMLISVKSNFSLTNLKM